MNGYRVLQRMEIGLQLEKMCRAAQRRCYITTWSLGSNVAAWPLGESLLARAHVQVAAVVVDFSGTVSHVDIDSLETLLTRLPPGSVFRHPSCHAKLALIDSEAMVGSANISQAALGGSNWEVAVWSRDPGFVAKVEAFLADIMAESTPVTSTDLDALRRHRAALKAPMPQTTPDIKWPPRSGAEPRAFPERNRHRGALDETTFLARCDSDGQAAYRALLSGVGRVRELAKHGGVHTANWTLSLPVGRGKLKIIEASPLYGGDQRERARQALYVGLQDAVKKLPQHAKKLEAMRQRLLETRLFEEAGDDESVRWTIRSQPTDLNESVELVVEVARNVARLLHR